MFLRFVVTSVFFLMVESLAQGTDYGALPLNEEALPDVSGMVAKGVDHCVLPLDAEGDPDVLAMMAQGGFDGVTCDPGYLTDPLEKILDRLDANPLDTDLNEYILHLHARTLQEEDADQEAWNSLGACYLWVHQDASLEKKFRWWRFDMPQETHSFRLDPLPALTSSQVQCLVRDRSIVSLCVADMRHLLELDFLDIVHKMILQKNAANPRLESIRRNNNVLLHQYARTFERSHVALLDALNLWLLTQDLYGF